MEVDQDLQNLLDSQEDEENELVLSPAALIQVMEEAWLNEKFAPEVLPNKIEFVELLLGQLTAMEENLINASDKDIKKGIHQLEVDRLKFLVCSYLRIRLEKIEMYVEKVLKEENARIERGEECYLTEAELSFAEGYKGIVDKHFDNQMNIHPTIPTEWRNQVIQPNLHSFVFSKSKANIESIIIDEGNEDETVYVNKDSQMIISYNSVSNLVKNGDVQLI
ncbi:DNA replication complex GINS protein SLD5 [Coccinella septempunctata]|uniref:DNA replication complex GINS protein SLD5 n=1 Tax=Coccinella septempunctata TaxID=41139 RepID=UPI001D05C596|nr:DNA replication complex GINS protein SLD5 [Coccinella septempunctata]